MRGVVLLCDRFFCGTMTRLCVEAMCGVCDVM
jgi:hypothetical protein